MGSSLVRWIIAGVLLAIFVALIVTDELGGTPTVPVGADGTGPATLAVAGGDGQAPYAPPSTPQEDRERKPALESACAPVTGPLLQKYGETWLSELGDKLFASATDDDIIRLCNELAALSEAQRMERLQAMTGMTPPAP